MKKILFFILIFSAECNYAQQNVQLANRYFENTDYSEAIPIYLDAANENQSADLVRNLADSFYFTNDFKNAQRWYAILEKKFPDEFNDEYYFRYIHALKAVGDYDTAYKLLRKNAISEARATKVETEIKDLEKISALGQRFRIRDLQFNTTYSEFGAVEVNDSIIFTGSTAAKKSSKIYKWTNQKYLNLMAFAIKDSAATNLTAKIYAPEINTEMHEGNAVFTKDGKYMYFTRNNFHNGKRAKDSNNTSNLQIYRAERVAGKWVNAVSLPFNSDKYSTEHPALSSDEKTLYFASDMPGSMGSFDIYSVSVNDRNYAVPTNLGNTINTVHKEQFPFISSDNKLYFSSDGHFGFGALDVFVSEITASGFTTPINIGLPVNSGYDDFAFTINTASKKGYFASNRPNGAGNDDIYQLVEMFPLKTEGLVASDTIVSEISDKQSRIDAITANEPDVIRDDKGRLIIKTQPIYFDYDLWYIRKESKPILDRVIYLMKQYPQIRIEIGSHTDVRGNNAYNQELSAKRASSTRDYFIESGIVENRITSKGYGETVPIINCVPESACSEEQHELNRRSEFVIIGI